MDNKTGVSCFLTGTSQSRCHVPEWFFSLTGKETSHGDVVSLLQADMELMKQQYELMKQQYELMKREQDYQIKELEVKVMELKTRIGLLEGGGKCKSVLGYIESVAKLPDMCF